MKTHSSHWTGALGVMLALSLWTVAAAAPSETPPSSGPIRVGVVVSHYTATGPTYDVKPYGYGHARIARVFSEAGHRVTAIVEPGSEKDEGLRAALRDLGLADSWILASDAKALDRLEVIVSGFNPNLRVEMIEALAQAVRQGTHFLNIDAFGTVNPAYCEQIETLLGVGQGEYHWRASAMPCEIAEPGHPLMAGFAADKEFTLPGLDSWAGAVDGTPLLRPGGKIREFKTASAKVCPLYVRKLGEGTVVNAQWHGDIADSGAPMASEQFALRCVQWLARPAAGVYTPPKHERPEKRRPPGSEIPDVHLSDLKALKFKCGYFDSPRKDLAVEGQPLRVAGFEFERGIGTHAASELVYALKPKYKRFVAVVGVDEEIKSNSRSTVDFEVRVDGRRLYKSPVMRYGDFRVVNVEIPPRSRRVDLIVTGCGDGWWADHADWAIAGFMLE